MLTFTTSSFSFNLNIEIGLEYLVTWNDSKSILFTIPSLVNAVTYVSSNLFTAIDLTTFSPSLIATILLT